MTGTESTGTDDRTIPPERADDERGAQSGPVVHGGKGDPLGGGVAEMKPSPEVSEGEPEQDSEALDSDR